MNDNKNRLLKYDYQCLTNKNLVIKLYDFFRYKYSDFKNFKKNKKNRKFDEYGLTIFCGRQGSGKSISLVERLEYIRKTYPEVKILTNFGYIHEDEPLESWETVLLEKNDFNGVVFAIDEIQNEFDIYNTRNFNLDLLKLITQQRKQNIKIYATSQVFTRVSKPLREQCFEVVECVTFLKRWTFQKCFDADDYNYYIDMGDPTRKMRIRRKWRKNFVHNDDIRELFDSYAVINSMKKLVAHSKTSEKK